MQLLPDDTVTIDRWPMAGAALVQMDGCGISDLAMTLAVPRRHPGRSILVTGSTGQEIR